MGLKNTSSVRATLIAIFLTAIISVSALAVIASGENIYQYSNPRFYHASLSGSYTLNGGSEELPLPEDLNFELPRGKNSMVFNGHFNQPISDSDCVMLRIINMRVNFYINGERVYSFGDPSTLPSFVKSAGNVWDSFPSNGITPQDDIRIELENIYTNRDMISFHSFFKDMYYGDEGSLIVSNIINNMPNSFLSIFIFCIGIAMIAVYIMMRYTKQHMPLMLSFAMLCLCSGMWFFTDFNVQSYYVPDPIFSNSMDIVLIMFTAIFLILYFYYCMQNSQRRTLLYLIYVWLGLLLISTITQLTGIADYYEYWDAITLLLLATVGIKFILFILEWRRHPGTQIKELTIAATIICTGIVLDAFLNWLQITTGIFWFKLCFLISMLYQFMLVGKYVKKVFADQAQLKILEMRHAELARTLEYQRLFTESTKGLYDLVYELDITNDCAGDQSARKYFESLGLSADTHIADALRYIAKNHIAAEYAEGYLKMFDPHNILEEFSHGVESLHYDFPFSRDGSEYYWVRLNTRTFFWQSDKTIRMIVFRQNIDDEKRREQELSDKARRDTFTGLYNKTATTELINSSLENPRHELYAFFIMDIDDFKTVNDRFGHDVGDKVINLFADNLKSQFRTYDIIGRIGGDEFAVFLPIPGHEWLKDKAAAVVKSLSREYVFDSQICKTSVSMGISVAPSDGADFETLYVAADKALYHTKSEGKNGYTIYGDM